MLDKDKSNSVRMEITQMPAMQLYGVTISKWKMRETIAFLQQHLESESRKPYQVITANPIMIMAGLDNDRFMHVLRSAELVVPDGMGIVAASRIVSNPIPERVAGFDLMQALLSIGNDKRYNIYLLGSTEEVVEKVVHHIEHRFPGVQIVGYHHGFFGEEEDKQIIQKIRECAPDILFVARGLETQEPWIGRYKHELNVPVMMGVGGSFDVLAGKTKRAPVIFQKTGLEWFYRLVREPSRFKRMLVLPKFAWKVLCERGEIKKQNESQTR